MVCGLPLPCVQGVHHATLLCRTPGEVRGGGTTARACVQSPPVVGALLVATFLVAPAAWILAGAGMTVSAAVGDACLMMARHAAGERNGWVLESMQCDDIAQAWGAAQEMMRASNNQTASANAAIERALPCSSWHCDCLALRLIDSRVPRRCVCLGCQNLLRSATLVLLTSSQGGRSKLSERANE